MSTVDDITLERIIERYDERRNLYEDFMSRQVTLLTEFLAENGPRVFSVTGRVKSRDSLRRKLLSGPPYTRLEEVKDLVGIRIVTFFQSEVDQVADQIRKEFQIDEAFIFDRGEALDPERWGYGARHYIASMLESRLRLIEYKRFVGCQAEIQVRSLLQHSWAEIEAVMGYTTRESFPRERRRQFARVAGLLELADQEYNEIHQFLKPYEQRKAQEAAQSASEDKPQVRRDPVGRDALLDFVRENPTCRDLDARLAATINVNVQDNDAFIDKLLEHLAYVDVTTMTQLENELRTQRKSILGIGGQLFSRHGGERDYAALWRGISVYMVCYTLAASSQKADQILLYLDRTEIGPLLERDDLADDLDHW
ncbi:GTP pyrophosphokinase [Magnetofaba australis]|uniref:Putative RelA/SpoT domain-containing protein n=1 Tax=Magnetofaba australis IT-1 TaxID=1434232 RepID=A0A1Y2K3N9_9PROT|nr:hypothetical protein [Magnetofaba australis]OSM01645.1 putative RelA/SpoT domain-containing protein [Magnetofaba australis IT-1]